MSQISLVNVHYNAQDRAFVARADVTRNGKTLRYPCAVFGPASLDPQQVTARLHARALRMVNPSCH
jgi:hypothetical protein